MTRFLSRFLPLLLSGALVAPFIASAQTPSDDPNEMTEVEKAKRFTSLSQPYRDWLTEDVAYIITREESSAFLQLEGDEERDQFIEQFWQRRNPGPDSQDNTFEGEHYRRIAYSNQHFSTETVSGQESDCGKVYIEWGPPDEIEDAPLDGTGHRQTWNYHYLEGIGENVELEFVDSQIFGDFHLNLSPEERDRLFRYQAGTDPLTWREFLGFRSDADAEVQPHLSSRFKALEAITTSHLIRNQVDFAYYLDSVPATHFTTMVTITIEVPMVEFSLPTQPSGQPTPLNLFFRLATVGGRVAKTYEGSIPESGDATQNSSDPVRFGKNIPLRPGDYDVAIVVENPESGLIRIVYTKLTVPPMARQ